MFNLWIQMLKACGQRFNFGSQMFNPDIPRFDIWIQLFNFGKPIFGLRNPRLNPKRQKLSFWNGKRSLETPGLNQRFQIFNLCALKFDLRYHDGFQTIPSSMLGMCSSVREMVALTSACSASGVLASNRFQTGAAKHSSRVTAT